MIRIRRVVDGALPTDADALALVVELLQSRCPGAHEGEFVLLPAKLENPFPT